MDTMQTVATVVIVGIIVIVLFKIIKTPLKLAFKLLLNTIIGFVLLILINFFGSYIGISLGINWFNAIVIGIFGLPGAALLLLLQWLMII